MKAEKKGSRCRNSPTCTLSQNGYGERQCLTTAMLTFMEPANLKADSTLRSSLCRLTSEVRRDPVLSATVWPSAKHMVLEELKKADVGGIDSCHMLQRLI